MANGKASGKFVVFADGFAGAVKEPGQAAHRPTGLAAGPDGALYIADDQHGRIWRVTFHGDTASTGIAAAAPSSGGSARASADDATPPEGIHPDAGNTAKTLPVPPGATAAQVALGDRVFHGREGGGTCEGCHGTDGKGTAQGADLTSGKYLWGDGSPAAIRNTIKTGVANPKESTGVMPPMGGIVLSPQDLAAVAAYVWALGHPGGG